MKSLTFKIIIGILSVPSFASAYGPGMMSGNGMGWFGLIIMGLFWAALIGVIFLFVKWIIPSDRTEKNDGTYIPRERNAAGK